MVKKIDRRNFLKNTSLSATSMIAYGALPVLSSAKNNVSDSSSFSVRSIMKEAMKYRKIDAHNHVGVGVVDNSDISPLLREQLDIADRLGIEKMVISRPIPEQSGSKATPEEVRECNDIILKAMKQHPDRYLGQVYINPINKKESLEEIDRCIDQGMIAMKFYNQVKINSPLFYPVIEKFIDLKMVIMGHAAAGLGIGGYRPEYGNSKSCVSVPEDFAEAAKRYPEAMFQYAHTGGGGDWEYACKMLRDCPNVYVDLSGSNNEANMVDFALKYLGEDRLLFGTDRSYYQGVGVILSARLTNNQKEKIFFSNFNNILRKSGNQIS